jgi:hypothetical protein
MPSVAKLAEAGLLGREVRSFDVSTFVVFTGEIRVDKLTG